MTDGTHRVVLVHGAVDRAASFDAVRELLGTGLETEAHDRRGYGAAWTRPVGRMLDHVDDLEAVVGERPCTVVGHSMGGIVALGVALRCPDVVRSVVLYETPLPWAWWWTDRDRQELVDETRTSAERAHREHLDARRRTAWRTCLSDVRTSLTEPFPWREVRVPVTVGWGSASTSRSARDAPRVADALGARLVTVVGAGHLAHRNHPEAFAAFVADALAHMDSADRPRPVAARR